MNGGKLFRLEEAINFLKEIVHPSDGLLIEPYPSGGESEKKRYLTISIVKYGIWVNLLTNYKMREMEALIALGNGNRCRSVNGSERHSDTGRMLALQHLRTTLLAGTPITTASEAFQPTTNLTIAMIGLT